MMLESRDENALSDRSTVSTTASRFQYSHCHLLRREDFEFQTLMNMDYAVNITGLGVFKWRQTGGYVRWFLALQRVKSCATFEIPFLISKIHNEYHRLWKGLAGGGGSRNTVRVT